VRSSCSWCHLDLCPSLRAPVVVVAVWLMERRLAFIGPEMGGDGPGVSVRVWDDGIVHGWGVR